MGKITIAIFTHEGEKKKFIIPEDVTDPAEWVRGFIEAKKQKGEEWAFLESVEEEKMNKTRERG